MSDHGIRLAKLGSGTTRIRKPQRPRARIFHLGWWVAVAVRVVVVRVCLTVFTFLAKILPPQNCPHAFASALTVTAALCGEPEPVTSAEQEKAAASAWMPKEPLSFLARKSALSPSHGQEASNGHQQGRVSVRSALVSCDS
jgi:hypothetical protein